MSDRETVLSEALLIAGQNALEMEARIKELEWAVRELQDTNVDSRHEYASDRLFDAVQSCWSAYKESDE